MSFMLYKKKRYKFHTKFLLEELASVPFVSGILFAKVRLLDGGSFTEFSSRVEVRKHCVKWASQFDFQSKLTSCASTGVLEQCLCRVSVRRELKGGRSYQKLGYVDINLAEFAGSGAMSRRYLLEGYDSKHRQVNSTIKVTIEMLLVSGDPVFKVPSNPVNRVATDLAEESQTESTKHDNGSEGSSGFGSLPRKDKHHPLPPQPSESQSSIESGEKRDFDLGHSRNSSYASQHSRGSAGYGSLPESSLAGEAGCVHTRTQSSASTMTEGMKLDRRRKYEDNIKERRVDATRVDPEHLINELLKETDFGMEDSGEHSGLQLLVGRDGTTALR